MQHEEDEENEVTEGKRSYNQLMDDAAEHSIMRVLTTNHRKYIYF